jgi:CubicO group peptidase (beta-lactamase class C family)
MERNSRTRYLAEALLIDGFERLIFQDPDRRILDTEMPAANGVFTARSLARMYAALATDGSVDGVRILSPETLHEAGRVQNRGRDYVLGLPMRWRLGYHQAFTVGRPAWKAFGHFGYGGSGAWADPESGLSLAFVTNRLGSVTTPVGDVRLPRLGTAALNVVRGLS